MVQATVDDEEGLTARLLAVDARASRRTRTRRRCSGRARSRRARPAGWAGSGRRGAAGGSRRSPRGRAADRGRSTGSRSRRRGSGSGPAPARSRPARSASSTVLRWASQRISALRFCEPAKMWKPRNSTSSSASRASSAGTSSASTPNCCGPPPIRIPEPLTWKSGLTRTATRGRIPSCSPIIATRSASVSDSISIVTPGGDRLGELGRGLARAGEADVIGWHRRVERDQHLGRGGDVEGVDQPAEVLDHRGHRVGLDRVAEVDPGGQRRAQQLDALGQQPAVVGEERRPADPLGEPVQRDPADAVAVDAALTAAVGDRGLAHAASSWRSRLRSNLLFGERGSSERTTTSLGTM